MTAAETHGLLAGKRILVVEDEYFIADDVRRALAEAQATVVGPVGTLAGGMAIADAGAVDLAVLDLQLGAEMGFAIADRLAERAIPFVLATGYARWTLPARFAGAKQVGKPYGSRQVIEALEGLIR